MLNKEKSLSLVLLVIGIIALVTLGMSLQQLVLEPGLPFEDIWAFLVNEFVGGFRQDYSIGSAVDVGIGQTIVDIVRIAYTIVLVCFPLALFVVLLTKESRKRLLRSLIVLFLLTVVLSRYLTNLPNEAIEDVQDSGAMVPPDSGELYETTIEDEFTPTIPRWIVLVITTVIVLTVTIIGIAIYRILNPRREAYEPLPQLAEQAQSAIMYLENGADFKNIILQCYAEMLRIVREYRGIQRNSAVTASEFILALVKIGLPEHAVTQLTRLFEEVRYGAKNLSYTEEQQAMGYLQLIANAFKVPS
jgi:hypothetical protein